MKEKFIQLRGPALYLTKDPNSIRQQLDGQLLTNVHPTDLMDSISTDHIIPSAACYNATTEEELGDHLLTGLPGGIIKKGEMKNHGFKTIVAGKSFGRGSSREHASIALDACAVEYICVQSIERIFEENCRNYGILTLDGRQPDLVRQFLDGEIIPLEEILTGLDQLQKEILAHNGLVPFAKARIEGLSGFSAESVPARPMTLVEKIIASHVIQNPHKLDAEAGIGYVQPHQTSFVRINHGYGYELQAPLWINALKEIFGEDYQINYPERFFFFEDHLALLEKNPNAVSFRNMQRDFAQKQSGSRVYYYDSQNGVEGICHSIMLHEPYVQPGDVVVGNDSHTCTLGAIGALAVGKGASEFAASMATTDIAITVPETIRFNIIGQLRPGVTSKDLMLYILALPKLRDTLFSSGKVFEFGGAGLSTMSFDEQVVLANMAIEGNAFTGIVEPNEQTIDYLANRNHLPRKTIKRLVKRSDADAIFSDIIEIKSDLIEPMIAMPGDPQKGVPLSLIRGNIQPVDIAYIGSCTGGKLEDLIRAAIILDGRKVTDSVQLYIQADSKSVLRAAYNLGLVEIFKQSGAQVLLPGCGACMNAGPGASVNKNQVTISDTNRNFPGRMGIGDTYLANPEVVAASAVKGKICSPQDL